MFGQSINLLVPNLINYYSCIKSPKVFPTYNMLKGNIFEHVICGYSIGNQGVLFRKRNVFSAKNSKRKRRVFSDEIRLF